MKLSCDFPRIEKEGLEKIRENLRIGCECGSETATLRKRLVGASVTVWLQCDVCGAGLGGQHSRKPHYSYQSYPEWDAQKREIYWQAKRVQHQAEWEKKRAIDLQAKQDDYVQRSREYFIWCRTSPEWKALRNRVLQRANRVCEACLRDEAVTAHHLTYEFGALPPAWHLVAVCRECHERLHADKRGEHDEWVPEYRRVAAVLDD